MEFITNRGSHVVLIDDNDCHLFRCHSICCNYDKRGDKWYAYATHWDKQAKKHVSYSVARMILGLKKGDQLEAEHINPSASLDNRRSNLRIATRAQNNANRRMRKDNTSGYKGVVAHPDGKRWIAQIMVNGKGINLGIFETREKAYAAYCLAAVEHHGEFARPERRADAENIQAQAAL